jgi:hyaluronoglucosaminidase
VQADVVDMRTQVTRAERIFFCPTYYSFDPILDRVFGKRPHNYLSDLGKLLDPLVRVYWTGPEVCSQEISSVRLRLVKREL